MYGLSTVPEYIACRRGSLFRAEISVLYTVYSALALFHRSKPKHLIKFIIQSIAFQMTTTTIRI